jgi:nucleoid DNA-binding protein
MTKTQLIAALAEEMEGTTKTHVRAFLTALTSVTGKFLKKESQVTIPGIAKLVLHKVPAKPERQARNPSTGAKMTVPPKPASKKLKARFVKQLKVVVGQLQESAPKAPKKK